MAENMIQVDSAILKEVDERIALALKSDKLEPHLMTALASLQPARRSLVSKGIAYGQGNFIGTQLAPEVMCSPDGNEVASYPVFNKEHWAVLDDTVSIGSRVKRVDIGMSWVDVTLDFHAAEAAVDPRETRMAANQGIDIAARKFDACKARVELTKERAIATLLTTGANYGSNTAALTSGGSGTQWSAYSSANSDPISTIIAADEAIRRTIGERTNTLMLSPNAYRALRFHPRLIALVSGGATKNTPAAPLGAEFIAALFGKSVLVGEGIYTSTVGGTPADVWGDTAALLKVGNGDMYDPQFAMTVTSSGYPKTKQFRDENEGAEGSEIYRYIDAYKPVVTLAAAGYLWTTVTGW